MALRPPSWGCLYLASVIAAGAAFFAVVTGRFWFDHDDPRDRTQGEAQYLLRLAAKSSGAQRLRWLNEALPLCFGLADAPGVLAILDELHAAGVEPRLDPRAAVVRDSVWAAGLTGDQWTAGTETALFVAKNAGPSPARLVLSFSAPDGAEHARFRRGRGEWQELAFSRHAGGNLARLEIALPAASGFELISVAAEMVHSPAGDSRQLGIHLERAEWLP